MLLSTARQERLQMRQRGAGYATRLLHFTPDCQLSFFASRINNEIANMNEYIAREK